MQESVINVYLCKWNQETSGLISSNKVCRKLQSFDVIDTYSDFLTIIIPRPDFNLSNTRI